MAHSIKAWSTICSEPENAWYQHHVGNQTSIHNHPCMSSTSQCLYQPSIQLAYHNVGLTVVTLGMANNPVCCWSIHPYYCSSNFLSICVSPPSHTSKPLHHPNLTEPPWHESSSGYFDLEVSNPSNPYRDSLL